MNYMNRFCEDFYYKIISPITICDSISLHYNGTRPTYCRVIHNGVTVDRCGSTKADPRCIYAMEHIMMEFTNAMSCYCNRIDCEKRPFINENVRGSWAFVFFGVGKTYRKVLTTFEIRKLGSDMRMYGEGYHLIQIGVDKDSRTALFLPNEDRSNQELVRRGIISDVHYTPVPVEQIPPEEWEFPWSWENTTQS